MYAAIVDVLPPDTVEHALEGRFCAAADGYGASQLVVCTVSSVRVYAVRVCGDGSSAADGGDAPAGNGSIVESSSNSSDAPSSRDDSTAHATTTRGTDRLLTLLSETFLPSRIYDAAVVRGEGARDLLLLALGDARFSVAEYDVRLGAWHTLSLHAFPTNQALAAQLETDAELARCGVRRHISVAPGAGVAALHVNAGHVAVLSEGRDDDVEVELRAEPRAAVWRSRVLAWREVDPRLVNVVDYCFLAGYHEPTAAVLYESRPTAPYRLPVLKDTLCLLIVSLGSGVCAPLAHYEGLPSDCRGLFALPLAAGGGVLVHGAHVLVHVDAARAAPAAVALNAYASVTTKMPGVVRVGAATLSVSLEAAVFFVEPLGGTLIAVADDGEWLRVSLQADRSAGRRVAVSPLDGRERDALVPPVLGAHGLPLRLAAPLGADMLLLAPVCGDAYVLGASREEGVVSAGCGDGLGAHSLAGDTCAEYDQSNGALDDNLDGGAAGVNPTGGHTGDNPHGNPTNGASQNSGHMDEDPYETNTTKTAQHSGHMDDDPYGTPTKTIRHHSGHMDDDPYGAPTKAINHHSGHMDDDPYGTTIVSTAQNSDHMEDDPYGNAAAGTENHTAHMDDDPYGTTIASAAQHSGDVGDDPYADVNDTGSGAQGGSVNTAADDDDPYAMLVDAPAAARVYAAPLGRPAAAHADDDDPYALLDARPRANARPVRETAKRVMRVLATIPSVGPVADACVGGDPAAEGAEIALVSGHKTHSCLAVVRSRQPCVTSALPVLHASADSACAARVAGTLHVAVNGRAGTRGALLRGGAWAEAAYLSSCDETVALLATDSGHLVQVTTRAICVHAVGGGASGHSEPCHNTSGLGEPGHNTSGHSEPGQSEPCHNTSGQSEPGHNTHGQSEPGHNTSGHSTHGYSTPGQSTPGQSTHSHISSGHSTPGREDANCKCSRVALPDGCSATSARLAGCLLAVQVAGGSLRAYVLGGGGVSPLSWADANEPSGAQVSTDADACAWDVRATSGGVYSHVLVTLCGGVLLIAGTKVGDGTISHTPLIRCADPGALPAAMCAGAADEAAPEVGATAGAVCAVSLVSESVLLVCTRTRGMAAYRVATHADEPYATRCAGCVRMALCAVPRPMGTPIGGFAFVDDGNGVGLLALDQHGWPRYVRLCAGAAAEECLPVHGDASFLVLRHRATAQVVPDSMWAPWPGDWAVQRTLDVCADAAAGRGALRRIVFHDGCYVAVAARLVAYAQILPVDEHTSLSDNVGLVPPAGGRPPTRPQHSVLLLGWRGGRMRVLDEARAQRAAAVPTGENTANPLAAAVAGVGTESAAGLLLGDAEYALSMAVATLETKQTKEGRKAFAVLGTSVFRGEDRPARGRVFVLDAVAVVPEAERPHADRRIKVLCVSDQRGPVTALAGLPSASAVVLGVAGRSIVAGLADDALLEGVAFADTGLYAADAAGAKAFFAVADAARGAALCAFQALPPAVAVLARDADGAACRALAAVALLVGAGGSAALLSADALAQLHVHAYAPGARTSLAGERLLCRGSLRLPSPVRCLRRIVVSYGGLSGGGESGSGVRAGYASYRGASGGGESGSGTRAGFGRGDSYRGTTSGSGESGPSARAGYGQSDSSAENTEHMHGTVVATAEGGTLLVVPVPESLCRRTGAAAARLAAAAAPAFGLDARTARLAAGGPGSRVRGLPGVSPARVFVDAGRAGAARLFDLPGAALSAIASAVGADDVLADARLLFAPIYAALS